MLSLRLAAVSGVLIVAAACGGNYSSSTPASPTAAPSAATPPASGGPSSSVSIPVGAAALGTAAFAPDALTVDAGTTVTWTNTDSVAHTSTSDASGWDSGIVAPGGQFSRSFQTAGTFRYHCAIHPGMVGTVVVR
jgi:plastocyanin